MIMKEALIEIVGLLLLVALLILMRRLAGLW